MNKKGTKTSFFSTIFADFLNQANIQFEPEFKIKNLTIKNLLKNELENQKYSKLDLNVNRFMDFYIPKYNLFIELNTLFTHCTEKHEKIHELKRDLAKKLNKNILFIWDSHFKEHEFGDDEICLYARYRSSDFLFNLERVVKYLDNLNTLKNLVYLNPYYYTGTIEEIKENYNKIYTSMTMDEMKEKWPEWYQKRVVENKPRGYIKFNKALYNWWLKICKGEDKTKQVKVGHRYFCTLALVAFATKCEIPKDKLIEDLHSLISIFNSLTGAENNPFLESDVDEALKIYGTPEAHKLKRDYIASNCGIEIKKTKRNGRTREEHIKIVNETRRIKYKLGLLKPTKKEKKKSKNQILLKKYLLENQDGKKKKAKDLAEILNVSETTIKRIYEDTEKEIFLEKNNNLNLSKYINELKKEKFFIFKELIINPELNKNQITKITAIGYSTVSKYYDEIKEIIEKIKRNSN